MSTHTFERAALINTTRTILDTAKAAGRDLNDNEAAEAEANISAIRALDTKMNAGPSIVDRVMALGKVGDNETNSGAGRGGGNLFSPEVKSAVASAISHRQSYRATLDAKAALTSGTLLPTGGSLVQGGLHPGSQFPLASLFQNLPADGPSQRYYRFSSGTAATVAEGGLKPDAGVGITAVDLLIAKIATTAQFSDEMAEDAPFLVSYLQAELTAAVLAAENAAIVATFGSTSGVLTGTSTAATVVDLLATAIGGQEALSGITPSAVVVNPSVLATIRTTKATTSGVYVADPLAAGPTSIHGVPVISTPAVAPAVAWLVDSSGVVIYRRGGLVVEVGTNADDWNHNLRTMRAEERMGTAVVRPTALTKLTLT